MNYHSWQLTHNFNIGLTLFLNKYPRSSLSCCNTLPPCMTMSHSFPVRSKWQWCCIYLIDHVIALWENTLHHGKIIELFCIKLCKLFQPHNHTPKALTGDRWIMYGKNATALWKNNACWIKQWYLHEDFIEFLRDVTAPDSRPHKLTPLPGDVTVHLPVPQVLVWYMLQEHGSLQGSKIPEKCIYWIRVLFHRGHLSDFLSVSTESLRAD